MRSVEELSRIVQVPEHTIRRWLNDGTIPGIKIGRQWRISEKVFQDIIKEGINVDQS